MCKWCSLEQKYEEALKRIYELKQENEELKNKINEIIPPINSGINGTILELFLNNKIEFPSQNESLEK